MKQEKFRKEILYLLILTGLVSIFLYLFFPNHYGYAGDYTGGFLDSYPSTCDCLNFKGDAVFRFFEGSWTNPNYCSFVINKEYCPR